MFLTRKVLTEKCSIELLVNRIREAKNTVVRHQDYEMAAIIRDIEVYVVKGSPDTIRKEYYSILKRLIESEDWFEKRKTDKIV